MNLSMLARWSAWWLAWLAKPPWTITLRERGRVVLGAALGVGLVATLAPAWPVVLGLPWLMAPLGASAVLVFALPASPLAQPWPVVAGNTVSALAGLAAAQALGAWPPWAAAGAVAGALAAMLALRCLHPPGGAVALLAVIARLGDWHYALDPVAWDSLLLVLAAMAYNRATGRRYPHHARAQAPTAGPTAQRAWDFSDDDLREVLAQHNRIVDVPADELRELLVAAEALAVQRRFQSLRCRDVMTPGPLTVNFGTALHEAWPLLRQKRVKALPVVDRYGWVVGIVTEADFLRHAGLDGVQGPAGLDQRLRALLRPTPSTVADKPEVVGQIMTRQVRVCSADRPLADLIPLFAHEGHHHLPVIGADRRLVGILTQTDVVAALARVDGGLPASDA